MLPLYVRFIWLDLVILRRLHGSIDLLAVERYTFELGFAMTAVNSMLAIDAL